MKLYMLEQMTASMQKRQPKVDSDESEGEIGKQTATVSAINNFTKMKRGRLKFPRKIHRRHFKDLLVKHGVKPGETFTFKQEWKTQWAASGPWGGSLSLSAK